VCCYLRGGGDAGGAVGAAGSGGAAGAAGGSGGAAGAERAALGVGLCNMQVGVDLILGVFVRLE